jgi:hypothetical protein
VSEIPPIPPGTLPSQAQIEEYDARFRRSNLGGDDLATKIVFAVIVLALVGYAMIAWVNRAHTAVKPPPNLQRHR